MRPPASWPAHRETSSSRASRLPGDREELLAGPDRSRHPSTRMRASLLAVSLTILVACSGDRSIGPAGSALAGVSIDTSVTARYRKGLRLGKTGAHRWHARGSAQQGAHPSALGGRGGREGSWRAHLVDRRARLRVISQPPRRDNLTTNLDVRHRDRLGRGMCPGANLLSYQPGQRSPATYQVEAPRLRASVVVPP
jgi:hypothetical protein